MPQINRIRITNIKYDNEKKYLPDITFEARGHDTLLILANGGGKSLLVQLILQVVLPNTRMEKRKVEDLLISGNYTGHVAVEWILETSGEHREFLCTGFCFSKGQSSDRSLRYYNYLFDYDEDSDLTIESLPLVYSDGNGDPRPIQFQALKDWLRDRGIQPVDRVETYQDRLKIYHILPEEWKNIRDTNGAEGGVDKFFEKSKTTVQLMDNLLIPSVEEMIYRNEDKKQELVHAFAQHREMLLEIPVIKQNLQDFALIRDSAESVVKEVEVLDRLQKEFDAATEEIVKLSRSFYEFSKSAEKALEDLSREKDSVAEQSRELEWQERSYEWFSKQLGLAAAEKKGKQAADLFAEAEQRLREAKINEDRLDALYYFNQGETARQDELRHRNALELMEQAEPELQTMLEKKKKVLKAAWKERYVLLQNRLEAGKKSLKELREEREVLKRELSAARSKESKFQRETGALDNWFKEYDQKREALLAVTASGEVLDPARALEKRQEKLSALEEREQEIIASRRKLLSKIENLDQLILDLRNEKNRVETDAGVINEKLEGFRRDEDALRGDLAANGIFLRNLPEEKERVLLRLKDVLADVQEQKSRCQAELANFQEKWALLEGRDYYVSHHDLLKIKSRLERGGVYVVLGSEWLAGQPLSENEKENILQEYPLLPFSILIEANQVNTVRHIVRQGKEWTCDVPLLFLVKSGELLQGEGLGEDFVPLWEDGLFLFRPTGLKVYTSGEAFQELKSRLQEKVKAKEVELQEEINRERTFIGLQERVSSFFRQYPDEQVKGWEEQRLRLNAECASLEGQIESSEKQRKEWKEELSGFESTLAAIHEEKENLKGIIAKLAAFREQFLLFPGKMAQKRELEEQIRHLNSILHEGDERLTDISHQEYEKKSRIRELEAAIGALEDDSSRFRLEEIAPEEMEQAFCIPVDYEDARVEVESVLKQLEEKQGERGNIQELLNKALQQYRESMSRVEETGVEIEWLKANRRPVTREEMKEASKVVAEKSLMREKKKEDWNAAQQEVERNRGVVEHIAGEILKEFGKEPYHCFDEASHQLQISSIKQGLDELKERMARISEEISLQEAWRKETLDAYESVVEKMGEDISCIWEQVIPYSYEEWPTLNIKPRRALDRAEKKRIDCGEQVQRQKSIVDRRFEDYLDKLETTKNTKVRQFIRDVRTIMDENRLYDYQFVQDQFLRIFEGLDVLETQYNNTLAECEKNKVHLVDLSLRRAFSVYDSVIEIPKSSRVRIYDREIQVIRISWPRRDEEECNQRMSYYIEQALEDLQVAKQQGKSDDEINRIMETRLKTRNLVEQIAPIDNCRVTVYKPRKESMIRYGRPEYAPWDEVPKWSGGEEYSVYVTMFMIVLTYIRQQSEGRRNAWKVLLADNPFGRASSSHVWEPVFQIAGANRIQLICLTAHKQEDILKRFPVVYSLQLRSVYGKEIMQAELLESGFYRLDTASADGAQVMLPI
ncbi:MAG: hypothetical protein ACOX2P_01815 [Bacillota bacterium]